MRSLVAVLALATIAFAGNDLDLPVDKPGPRVSPKPVVAPDPEPEQADEKPPTIYGSETPSGSRSIFFVLDISGSMGLDLDSEWLDRLGRAKRELTRAIQTLPPAWSFGVIAYDCDVYAWRDTLTAADKANKDSACAWVSGLKPQGATGTGLAVGTALARARDNMLVILLTDGDPNCNSMTMNGNVPAEIHRQDIKTANVQRASINVFGIDAVGVFKDFCVNVASDNNGVFVAVR